MSSRPRPLPHPPSRMTTSFRSRQVVTHQNQLTEKLLLQLLDNLQHRLLERRGEQTTLVVHGGVVSLLTHKTRTVTTDIDYIERVLPEELDLPMKKPGFSGRSFWKRAEHLFCCRKPQDTRTIIKESIAEVAAEYNDGHTSPFVVLEHDWMNSDADVALPWYLDNDLHMVNPLVISAVRAAENGGVVVYDSPGLRLLGITPAWNFALKLQRFTDEDEEEIVLILQRGRACAYYTEDQFIRRIEEWLRQECPVMDYEHFPERTMREWRSRLWGCVRKAKVRQRQMSSGGFG